MARVSEKSAIYRTKALMVSDVFHALNAQDLSYAAKYAVIDQVLWVWSEFDGKHAGCRYWSKRALDSGGKKDGLVHEHLVPRKVIRARLFSLDKPTMAGIDEILTRLCIGVVVTREEDADLRKNKLQKSMPADWDGSDVWARYTMCDIVVDRISVRP